MDNDMTLCPCCMEKHEMQIVSFMQNNVFKGVPIEYRVECFYCPRTDEYYCDEDQITANNIAMKEAFREKTQETDVGEEETRKIEEASKEQFTGYQHALAERIPDSNNDALLFVMSSAASYYFESLILRKAGELDFLTDPYIHTGLLQDSVIIGDMETLDFRFFPYKGNRLRFYAWDNGHGDVYVYNSGKEALEVDCPAGLFLINPGAIELLGERNKTAQIQEHIAPAIDRYTVWHAHADEDGTVYYT